MRYLAIISFIINHYSFSQMKGSWHESGQFNLRINADGQMANFNNNPSSEFKKGSNNHIFKFINIWISALDMSNNLYTTSVNGFSNISDYSPGPLDSLTFAGADPADWNSVWEVTASEIYEHKKNYKNSNYTISNSIKNWPSNGSDRFNAYLAPFTDYDNNGRYNPENGDYPAILGDKAAYFIVNDNYTEHKASGGQPLKVELYGMVYSYNELPNTVYIKYYIVNRTSKDFKDLRISFHAGFELGNNLDNYCGTLVPKNLIFSYNGDGDDENHFGFSKPLASVMVLNKNLASSLYIDRDSLKMTGMPNSPNQLRNMMIGKWKFSNDLTYGNDGTGAGKNCRFVYPGSSDPLFKGQTWEENLSPGERSMLANIEEPTLKAKGYISLDIAISAFEKSIGNPYEFLDDRADEIRNIWLQKSGKIDQNKITFAAIKNPNKSGENLYQEWFNNFNNILIFNAYGQLLKQIIPNDENMLIIDTPGLFYINLISDNVIITKKIQIL